MTREELRDFTIWLHATGLVLYGERVMMVRDPDVKMFGTLHVPDQYKPKRASGTVVMVGLGIADDHQAIGGLTVGDRVMFSKHYTITATYKDRNGKGIEVEIFAATDIYTGRRPVDGLFQREDIDDQVEALTVDPRTAEIRRQQEAE